VSALVNRSREEGAELRPFTGLEVFENLLAGSSLIASTLYGEVEISARGSGQLNGLSVDKVGYRLKLGLGLSEMATLCQDFGLKIEQIDLVVIVRDQKSSTLHEAEILKVLNGSGLSSEVILVARDDPRSRLMTNRYTGFEFEAFLILNSDVLPRPLKPRRRGTILAQTKFTVNILDKKGGLKPYPLTAQVREDNELPNAVWLWVDEESESLLEAVSLKDAFSIYVDEEVLILMNRLAGSARSFALQTIIASALAQIVRSMSAELSLPLHTDFKFDGNGSAVLKLLFKKFQKVKASITHEEFIEILRNKPSHAVAYTLAQTTGPAGSKSDIKKWINDLIGENDVPAT
jgi:hypothetical protein